MGIAAYDIQSLDLCITLCNWVLNEADLFKSNSILIYKDTNIVRKP